MPICCIYFLFLPQDVVLDAVDSNNKTPLRLAMGRDHKEIVHYLQSKLNRLVSCHIRYVCFLAVLYSTHTLKWVSSDFYQPSRACYCVEKMFKMFEPFYQFVVESEFAVSHKGT